MKKIILTGFFLSYLLPLSGMEKETILQRLYRHTFIFVDNIDFLAHQEDNKVRDLQKEIIMREMDNHLRYIAQLLDRNKIDSNERADYERLLLDYQELQRQIDAMTTPQERAAQTAAEFSTLLSYYKTINSNLVNRFLPTIQNVQDAEIELRTGMDISIIYLKTLIDQSQGNEQTIYRALLRRYYNMDDLINTRFIHGLDPHFNRYYLPSLPPNNF